MRSRRPRSSKPSRLVRQGRVFDLAHVLHDDIPAFPGRSFRQYLTTNAHQLNRRRADAGAARSGAQQRELDRRAGRRRPRRWARTSTGSTTSRSATAPTTATGSTTSSRSTAPTGSASTRCRRWSPAVCCRRRRRPWRRAAGPGDVITPDDVERASRPWAQRRPRRRGPVPHRLGRAVGRSTTSATRRASPAPGWRCRVAGRAPRVAHRLRHLELRPGSGRGPRRAVRGPPDAQRQARRRRAPRTCAWPSWPPPVSPSSCSWSSHPKLRGATGAWVAPLAIA